MANERNFLHDMASPMGTVIFLIDAVIDDATTNGKIDKENLALLEKVQEQLERLKEMLDNRRQVLIQQGVKSEKS